MEVVSSTFSHHVSDMWSCKKILSNYVVRIKYTTLKLNMIRGRAITKTKLIDSRSLKGTFGKMIWQIEIMKMLKTYHKNQMSTNL